MQINGNVNMQTPPMNWYNTTNAATDKRKRIQYKPEDFFVFAMKKIYCENRINKLNMSDMKLPKVEFLSILQKSILN